METILQDSNYQYYIMPTTLITSEDELDKYSDRGRRISEQTSFGNNSLEVKITIDALSI